MVSLNAQEKNTDKYITFSVPISKESDNGKTITYRLKFIGSFRFNLDQILLITYLKFTKKQCKGCKERRKSKSGCSFIGLKNNKLNYKCKKCKKRWLKPINQLIKMFPNIHQFCNIDINKFVSSLRKGVYPYEYMDIGKDLMKYHCPIKKLFTVNCIQKTLLIKAIHMFKKCLKNLT